MPSYRVDRQEEDPPFVTWADSDECRLLGENTTFLQFPPSLPKSPMYLFQGILCDVVLKLQNQNRVRN